MRSKVRITSNLDWNVGQKNRQTGIFQDKQTISVALKNRWLQWKMDEDTDV